MTDIPFLTFTSPLLKWDTMRHMLIQDMDNPNRWGKVTTFVYARVRPQSFSFFVPSSIPDVNFIVGMWIYERLCKTG
jgi:hypothetical protein